MKMGEISPVGATFTYTENMMREQKNRASSCFTVPGLLDDVDLLAGSLAAPPH